MSEPMNTPQPETPFQRWIVMAAAITVFGLLMGMRGNLSSAWLRAAAAGAAFAVLVPAVNYYRKTKPKGETQPPVAPNGGPGKPLDNSGSAEGPPSVT